MLPFNVELMNLTPQKLSRLKPVVVLDPFDGATENFHEDGLYSVSIFGRVGDERRDTQFSFIKLNTEILHPIIYLRLCRLKGIYKGIMAGSTYARFDEVEKDFVAASEMDGDTGYDFFMTHWKRIVFKKTKSAKRLKRIELVEKYKDISTTSNILVLPAGLRDLEVDESGRKREDEINDLYRRIIRIANGISYTSNQADNRVLNSPRHTLQLTFNEIYKTLEDMLTGKKGFLQAKWGSRAIFNGTRNVISAMDTSAEDLSQPNRARFTDTELGLFQTIKGCLPLAIHLLKTGYLSDIILDGELSARLVDKDTMQSERVRLSTKTYDRWATEEGLEKLIDRMGDAALRSQPIELEGYYLALIWLGNDGTFKVVDSIDEVPRSYLPEDEKGNRPTSSAMGRLEPITYAQLLYLSGYRKWNDLKVYVTRFPVTGLGSIYPSNLYIRTTIIGEVREELGMDWERMGDEYRALEFPNTQGQNDYMDSQVVHPSRLAGLGGDYDGDTASGNIAYTDDSIEEVNRLMGSKEMWLDPNGGFKASTSYDTINFVLRNMTGQEPVASVESISTEDATVKSFQDIFGGMFDDIKNKRALEKLRKEARIHCWSTSSWDPKLAKSRTSIYARSVLKFNEWEIPGEVAHLNALNVFSEDYLTSVKQTRKYLPWAIKALTEYKAWIEELASRVDYYDNMKDLNDWIEGNENPFRDLVEKYRDRVNAVSCDVYTAETASADSTEEETRIQTAKLARVEFVEPKSHKTIDIAKSDVGECYNLLVDLNKFIKDVAKLEHPKFPKGDIYDDYEDSEDVNVQWRLDLELSQYNENFMDMVKVALSCTGIIHDTTINASIPKVVSK